MGERKKGRRDARHERDETRRDETSLTTITTIFIEREREKESVKRTNGDRCGTRATRCRRRVQHARHGGRVFEERQSDLRCDEEREGISSNVLRRESTIRRNHIRSQEESGSGNRCSCREAASVLALQRAYG